MGLLIREVQINRGSGWEGLADTVVKGEEEVELTPALFDNCGFPISAL